MSRVVVDASVWVELLCGRERWRTLADRLLGGAELHVPALCDVEVVAALRKIALGGALDADALEVALENYRAVRLERHDHQNLLHRMLELRDNFTAYDAAYVALAEGLDASLATLDAGLARVAARVVDIEAVDLSTDS